MSTVKTKSMTRTLGLFSRQNFCSIRPVAFGSIGGAARFFFPARVCVSAFVEVQQRTSHVDIDALLLPLLQPAVCAGGMLDVDCENQIDDSHFGFV